MDIGLRKCSLAGACLLLAWTLHAGEPAPSLDWIAGHWCTKSDAVAVEEIWLPPHGGVVLGLGRTRTPEATTGFEYLRIVEVDGVPTYIAQPGGRAATKFRMTARGEQWIRFENPEHDFPQWIEYRRNGDRLHAEIAGPGEHGKEQVIGFDYERCEDTVTARGGSVADLYAPDRRALSLLRELNAGL